MPTYAEGTSVSVEKSRAELDAILQRNGARNRGIVVNDEEGIAMIGFVVGGLQYRLTLPLPKFETKPKDVPNTWHKMTDERRREWMQRRHEQRCRERWRAFCLLIKAKMASVQMGVSTIEREFMPDLVLPNGETVNVALAKEIQRALSTGEMPTLMLPAAK